MSNALAGKHILIVEDEYFIASDLKLALEKQDAVVLGPVAELSQGLALADEAGIDGAILDVNLEGANSFAIADKLSGRNVPYLFLTGYDGWALPKPYCDAPRMGKPFPMPAVLARIQTLLATEVQS